MLPTELIAAIAKEWGGYGVMFLFAGYTLWKYLTDSTIRRQKRLDDQQLYVDGNWNRIIADKETRILKLETEIKEIREGQQSRLDSFAEQLKFKREEIARLNALMISLRNDLERGWDLGRGAIKGWRSCYHDRNNDRQIVESIFRLNNIQLTIPWTTNAPPPDLEDVEPIKG